jgi:hypothetical protein
MAQRVGVVLSPAERELLAVIAADGNRAQKQVERARIVLARRIGIRRSRWRKHWRRLADGVAMTTALLLSCATNPQARQAADRGRNHGAVSQL